MSAENILRIDLQGVQVLIPHIITALDITLPVQEKELNLGYLETLSKVLTLLSN